MWAFTCWYEAMFINKQDKILIAGARGMVGSALTRCFLAHDYTHLLTPMHQELDYVDQQAVRAYLLRERPRLL